MTKRIKDFGAPIGGRRQKKNACILGQDVGDMADRGRKLRDPYSYMGQADRVGEEKGIYQIQKRQLREPDNRKKPLPYSKLDCVKRIGPEYLADGRHADENGFKELGIKGVEFGASLSDEEAQSLLDECYLAFCDLARVLGIDKKEVSLGGTLSLAFASRGNGGSGPATYDPKHHVINFTKEGGAGSLAHEWAHALDYYIGKSCRLGATLDMYVLRNYPNRAIEEPSRVHKEITGHVILKDKKRRINYRFASLNRTEQLPADFHRVQWKEEHTKFFNDSWELHERYARTVHGRHCDNCEQMARAFECYVADKLEQEGNQSQYLTAHSEDVIFVKENGDRVYGGPAGREREEINQKFDRMFEELKGMEILCWRDMEKDTENIANIEKRNSSQCSER